MASLEHLLAHRLMQNREKKTSRSIVKLSVIGIAVCLLIIIIALSVTSGYRNAIEQKVVDMGAHIRISRMEQNYSYDQRPFQPDAQLMKQLEQNPDIQHVQRVATQCGVVKTDDQVEGIVLKGIDPSFSWKIFSHNLIKGDTLQLAGDTLTKGILISQTLAQKLKLGIGDKVRAYFWNDGKKFDRPFFVRGIYSTGLPEYDERFILGDIRHVRKISGWEADDIGSLEILLYDYDKIEEVGEFVHQNISYDLKAETIKDIFPDIFQWTDLFDTNVIVLLAITLFVCVITLISTFFIIILEQTSTIGTLKALGMTTPRIRRVFMWVGMRLILIGMVLGNGIGILLCLLQKYLHIIKLDVTSYYVPYIPIEFNPSHLILVNAGVLLVCLLVLLIPATFVSRRISPINAIKFE